MVWLCVAREFNRSAGLRSCIKYPASDWPFARSRISQEHHGEARGTSQSSSSAFAQNAVEDADNPDPLGALWSFCGRGRGRISSLSRSFGGLSKHVSPTLSVRL